MPKPSGWEGSADLFLVCRSTPVAPYPFVQKDFESRYRGFATRQIVPEYPAVLRGTADVANDSNRSSWRPGIAQYQSQPVLIGPPDAVNAVISNGGNQAGVQITRLADLTDKLLPRA